QPYGMVLITGPTGSGKTTTLYSAISTINKVDHNIMTAEDPVEYNLKGVNQVQVNDGIGRTFAAVLRSFLRQDPDVILVGETRDLQLHRDEGPGGDLRGDADQRDHPRHDPRGRLDRGAPRAGAEGRHEDAAPGGHGQGAGGRDDRGRGRARDARMRAGAS